MPRLGRRWIVAGALLLAAPALARDAKTLRVRFPRVSVSPGANTEMCVLVRIPRTTSFDLGSWTIRHHGAGSTYGPRHFLVYAYTGEHLAAFGDAHGQIVASRGCLDLGPPDRDQRQLIASGAAPRSRGALPRGVALALDPVPDAPGGAPAGLGLVLDLEWVNSSTKAHTASVVVTLQRARPKDVHRRAHFIFSRGAEQTLLVPPDARASSEVGQPPYVATWGPGLPGGPAGAACVVALSGHLHKRGRFLGVDLLDGTGAVENPAGGPANPFEPGRTHFFAAVDFTDTGELRPAPPRLVAEGHALHHACWVDNGVTTAVRLGCEEQASVVPGAVGAPAKPCGVATPSSPDCPATDPAYPARTFTGACVAANLVAGPTPDDEVCILTGAYFDAVAGAPSGAECEATQAIP